jgi:glycosyltransferase involved in cell wall biosynthesis
VQLRQFAEYVAGAHSWYKHLRVLPAKTPIQVFLDPAAGRQLVQAPDGRVTAEIREKQGFHYSWLRTAEHRERFGQLVELLAERLRASGAKALWIQGWQVAAYWQAVREARAAGVEVWLRAESNDLAPTPAWKRPLKRIALGHFFAHIDRFLYIGTANNRLYQSFGVPQSRLYSAPYAIDNERFARQAAAMRPQRTELRRRWGIGNDAFCILFCGKFIAKKRPTDLIEAARALRSNGRLRDIHLLFAGSGELGVELRRSCDVVYDADCESAPRCGSSSPDSRDWVGRPPASFAGFLNQTEISRAYVAADCLVLPSDHGETWGLVVNEALASGLPCLVSDACGCAEDLIGNGLSFPMGDVAALAGKLVKLRLGQPFAPLTKLPSFDECISTISRVYQRGQAT